VPASPLRLLLTTVVLAAVAAGGAAVAIGVSGREPATVEIITATGGSVRAPAASGGQSGRLLAWPRRAGWTIVLRSVPKVEGRDEALAVAERARRRRLKQVGILDSSLYPSTQPGYWLVFAGVFRSEAEATSSLRAAKRVVKSARVQRVSR
jgi:hypothetical protein